MAFKGFNTSTAIQDVLRVEAETGDQGSPDEGSRRRIPKDAEFSEIYEPEKASLVLLREENAPPQRLPAKLESLIDLVGSHFGATAEECALFKRAAQLNPKESAIEFKEIYEQFIFPMRDTLSDKLAHAIHNNPDFYVIAFESGSTTSVVKFPKATNRHISALHGNTIVLDEENPFN